MKPIHWILLAGIGFYLYSKKSNAATYPGYHLMPQPDGSVKYMKDADHKSDVTYTMPPLIAEPLQTQSDYGHSYLPM
jgi:hypothetical protein